MPDMHGIDVLRFVRRHQHYRNLPVIVLTTRGDDSSRETAVEAGATTYLTKPFAPPDPGGDGSHAARRRRAIRTPGAGSRGRRILRGIPRRLLRGVRRAPDGRAQRAARARNVRRPAGRASAGSWTICSAISTRSRAFRRWWSCGRPSSSRTSSKTICARSRAGEVAVTTDGISLLIEGTQLLEQIVNAHRAGDRPPPIDEVVARIAAAVPRREQSPHGRAAGWRPRRRCGYRTGDRARGSARSRRRANCSPAGIGVDAIRKRLSEVGTIVEAVAARQARRFGRVRLHARDRGRTSTRKPPSTDEPIAVERLEPASARRVRAAAAPLPAEDADGGRRAAKADRRRTSCASIWPASMS